MRELNKYTRYGLLFNSIFLVGNGTEFLSEFIKGICVGVGITLIFMGMYSENHDMSKLRSFKKRLIGK